jgi:hypothetical protein
MDVHPADLHRSVAVRVDESIVQSEGAGCRAGQLDFALVGSEVVLRIGAIKILESGVSVRLGAVSVRLGAVHIRKVLAGNSPSKPAALDVGHVSHESQQQQIRRLNGVASELVRRKGIATKTIKIRPLCWSAGQSRATLSGCRSELDVSRFWP